MAWTAWPVARSPVRATIAIGVMALIGWTLQSLFRTAYFTALALLLVWGQVASFFLPTKFVLREDGVTVRGLLGRREKSWEEFRSFHIDPDGVLLSPFLTRSRLERFRGVSLQFHDNRDEVVAYVERKMVEERESREHVGDEGQGASSGGEGEAA